MAKAIPVPSQGRGRTRYRLGCGRARKPISYDRHEVCAPLGSGLSETNEKERRYQKPNERRAQNEGSGQWIKGETSSREARLVAADISVERAGLENVGAVPGEREKRRSSRLSVGKLERVDSSDEIHHRKP